MSESRTALDLANGPYHFDVRCGNAYKIDEHEVRGGDVLTIYGPSVRIGPFTNADTAEKVRKALNVAYSRGRSGNTYAGAMSIDGIPLGDPISCSVEVQAPEDKEYKREDGEGQDELRTALDLAHELARKVHGNWEVAFGLAHLHTLGRIEPLLNKLAAIPADAAEQIRLLQKEVEQLNDEVDLLRDSLMEYV